MKMIYTVSQVPNKKLWYTHRIGCPNIPIIIDGLHTFGTKKHALQTAAIMQCLPYEDYMELRRKTR